MLVTKEKVYVVTGSCLVSNVVCEAIACKKYPTLPRKLEIIVNKVTELYKREFKRNSSDDFYTIEFTSYETVYEWVRKNITSIREVQELNLSQSEINAGITLDTCDTLTSAEWKALLDNERSIAENEDYIDMGAFTRNLAYRLIGDSLKF